jgi:hypothetical protein
MLTRAVVVTGALAIVLSATPVDAQPHGTAAQPHQSEEKAPPAPGMPGAMPMQMCREMMADAGGMAADPKDRAAMLEMRGEMMKAMGDVMMKHARRMHAPKGAK